MKKTLVVLAAGMGSRFGGLKQIQPVGPNGEFIIDYSIHDAIKAGFEKVVFVIRKENLDVFKETIGKRVEDKVETVYAFQELDILPRKIEVKREKQFGTGHAVYCVKDYVDGPFAVISADDFYGPGAFDILADFINNETGVAVVGYKIGDTILGDEEVKRGVIIEEDGVIKAIRESACKKDSEKVTCRPLPEGEEYTMPLDGPVNMLMYGFNINFFDRCEEMLNDFLDKADLEVAEFFLPDVVDTFIKEGNAKLVKTNEHWMGMTYREDLIKVQEEIKSLIEKGVYNNNLWEE
ncbi:MAG: NTP transferase domain-containing protein [Bacilli bacterium]|nr:NTP transferase domain-containing protein [Bacilli bacterium]